MRDATRLFAAGLLLCVCGTGCSDTVGQSSNQWNMDEPEVAAKVGAPESIEFGAVEYGEEAQREVVLENLGDARLRIDEFGPGDDGVLSVVETSSQEPAPLWIEPGDSVAWTVSYQGHDVEATSGVIVVESNDGATPKLEIPWSAEVVGPCVATSPGDVIEFGDVEQGQVRMRRMSVTNCDDSREATVEVVGVEGDEGFFVDDGLSSGEAIELEPGASADVEVYFEPQEMRDFEARLVFSTDDPYNPAPSVELVGRGLRADCVHPVIDAQPEGGDGVSTTETTVLNTDPLETVSLDGSDSFDPEGGDIVEVAWSLVDSPEASTTLLESTSQWNTELYLDVVGTYVVELEAKNQDEKWSCGPARLTVEVLSDEDIYVQLVWNTPGDPNPHDGHGSDMDLHFLHPDGHWGELPYDCNWQNPAPQWTQEDDELGDPRLDVDATQGWGPENISLNDPDPELSYRVGVHYFADRELGESYATLRVFMQGELAAEMESEAMEAGQFWEVLDVDGALHGVEEIDLLYDEMPL